MSFISNQEREKMKEKTIKKVLRKKHDEWLESIEDDKVRSLVRSNTIITGGCIASMLLKETVNDFDVYFKNHETALAVANYYVSRFTIKKPQNGIVPTIFVRDENGRIEIVVKSAGVASETGTDKDYEYFEGSADVEAGGRYVSDLMSDTGDREEESENVPDEDKDDGRPKYRPVFLSSNAITLSNRIQIVLRFYGDAEELHKNYDFVHCTNYWESESGNLTLRPEALISLLARDLRYVGSKYPICSVIRLRKFIKRGWTVNAGQILKMMFQINALDLTDHKVLQDQLTGVDAAYFSQIVTLARQQNPDAVDSAYIAEIIDRMF